MAGPATPTGGWGWGTPCEASRLSARADACAALPARPEELAGLRSILGSGRISNYRLTEYVCNSKGHRLAEVLRAPEGTLLVVYGLSEKTLPAADDLDPGDLDALYALADRTVIYRYRDKTWVLKREDLETWNALGLSDTGLVFEFRCRCGRRELEARRVPSDLAGQRPRIRLRRDGTALVE